MTTPMTDACARLRFGLVRPGLCGCSAKRVRARQAAERLALRVCQDPNNLPFSNLDGAGHRRTALPSCVGKALGLPVTYYSFPQRLAFIRNTLRYKLPGRRLPLRHRDGRARRL